MHKICTSLPVVLYGILDMLTNSVLRTTQEFHHRPVKSLQDGYGCHDAWRPRSGKNGWLAPWTPWAPRRVWKERHKRIGKGEDVACS